MEKVSLVLNNAIKNERMAYRIDKRAKRNERDENSVSLLLSSGIICCCCHRRMLCIVTVVDVDAIVAVAVVDVDVTVVDTGVAFSKEERCRNSYSHVTSKALFCRSMYLRGHS
uniref:Uncharacterized protein n=1 Tax=Vespula pensylvanica TaxID=30213 RepID=A0A834U7Q2_VESPE|nr:hypothetical protein H0235_010452 [Vespula pensylvanica]